MEQISSQQRTAGEKVRAWEEGIKERDLQEKRRKAPGWLDSESKLLQPEKKQGSNQERDLIDQPEAEADVSKAKEQQRTANELGDAMDRAFGRSEMG